MGFPPLFFSHAGPPPSFFEWRILSTTVVSENDLFSSASSLSPGRPTGCTCAPCCYRLLHTVDDHSSHTHTHTQYLVLNRNNTDFLFHPFASVVFLTLFHFVHHRFTSVFFSLEFLSLLLSLCVRVCVSVCVCGQLFLVLQLMSEWIVSKQ